MKEIVKALTQAKMEIQPPKKDSVNPHFKSKYATLDEICRVIREPLCKNGLSLSHDVEKIDGEYFLVTTLSHVSGDWMKNKVPMFLEKTTNQGIGGAITYATRYGITALLSLPAEEDDDGEGAKKEEFRMTPKQLQWLIDLEKKNEEVAMNIRNHFKISSFSEFEKINLPKESFENIIKAFNGVRK